MYKNNNIFNSNVKLILVNEVIKNIKKRKTTLIAKQLSCEFSNE
jgi:hypothetical protein